MSIFTIASHLTLLLNFNSDYKLEIKSYFRLIFRKLRFYDSLSKYVETFESDTSKYITACYGIMSTYFKSNKGKHKDKISVFSDIFNIVDRRF